MVPIIKIIGSANLNGLITNKVRNRRAKNMIEGKYKNEATPKNIPILKIIFFGS
jgi:ATP-dependent protease HslVU (ClpYQ) ATPase subunit